MLTPPTDPVHAFYALYQQFGGLLSQGVDSVALTVIVIALVLLVLKPRKFVRMVGLMFTVIVIALVFAHWAGRF